MTTVTFENAALLDCIRKADKVAPSKGAAFDKAAGIVLDIFPDGEVQCVVRATNTDIFSAEAVSVLHAEGPIVRWRLSANVLSSVVQALPITNGKSCTFAQEGSKVKISSGRTKATMMLMDTESYPDWSNVDPTGMTSVTALGNRLSLVEWAASTGNEAPINGVHLNGTWAMATDRYRLVRVPCKIDNLTRPVTIPAGILSQVLRQMGDVGLAVRDSTLDIMVDQYHQVKTVIYDIPYPDLERIMRTDYPWSVELSKEEFISKCNAANSFAGADRTPMLQIFLGKQEVAFMMTNAEVGMLGDVIEVPGQLDHEPRCILLFTPKNITDAVSKVPTPRFKFHYDPDNTRRPVYVTSQDNGFEAWVMPRSMAQSQ